ncbi:MAG: lysine--tRNA ligase [Patescibacteria group bacterium]
MAEPLAQLRQIRLDKIQKIQSLGLNPFPGGCVSDRLNISSVSKKQIDDSVTIAGRLRAWRSHGQIVFADLEDASGRLQLFFSKKDLSDQQLPLLELLDLGDFIAATGTLFKTQAGQLTLKVSVFSLLTKTVRPLPSEWFGLKDCEERYRQRYLDLLLNKEVRDIVTLRADTVDYLRRYLKTEGFLEVETPILQPLYGGASARPFLTHHHALDTDLYLRISDELYLKRLIVAGFEKVFELGKDFRNEGIDREHNPEFTMLEFYWAYRDYEQLMSFTETMLSEMVKQVKGSYLVKYQDREYNFEPPWPRITFRDLLKKDSGIDLLKTDNEEKLLAEIKKKGLDVDLTGVAGFGPILDTLYKKISRSALTGPVFIIDHPLSMRPLAKGKQDEPAFVASFQLLVAGVEWINAYNELNDPRDQRQRWEEEMNLGKKGLAEHQVLDEDYLRALEYGMPPTAGWGMGIDRVVAFLADRHNLKETIIFPTLRPQGNPDPEVKE